MKKLMTITAISLFSFSALANYSCSGSGLNVDVDTNSITINVSGLFNGVVNNYRGSGEEMYGNATGDFKSLTVNVEDGEINIIKKGGRSTGYLAINCER
jgi:hypothetical protein